MTVVRLSASLPRWGLAGAIVACAVGAVDAVVGLAVSSPDFGQSAPVSGTSAPEPRGPAVPIERFFEATREDDLVAAAALRDIAPAWKNGLTPMFIDMARMMPGPRGGRPGGNADEAGSGLAGASDPDAGGDSARRGFAGAGDSPGMPDRGSSIRRRLLSFLERQTGKRFGDDLDAWRQWMWSLPYDPHPEYATLKAAIYGQIDPAMRTFFPPGVRASIRLDEIDWGGVTVNGIPPLRAPKVVRAADARYLGDSNVVFGIEVNGEARAYAKRILGWHEMAIDRIGGVDLTIVYCTLCGTVIPYESSIGGRQFRFGTSGLLYRSNKLMFDEDSRSLWSTLEGIPVAGSLVGSGLALRFRPVVTTTWKEWRTKYPSTTVLSIDTGFKRDYAEGAAYRDYFSTDRLMFQVSQKSTQLPNKAEVLVARLDDGQGGRVPVAINVRFLRSRAVYPFVVGSERYLVVTSPAGANQLFQIAADIAPQAASDRLTDRTGGVWRVTDVGLVSERNPQKLGPRIAAHRAFWFGWYAQFPSTRLIR